MMKLEIDKSTQKLFLLNTLDPFEGREDEAERLIHPFARHGFRYYNTVVFVSEEKIETISAFIRQHKTEKYQFFLTDITDNIDKNNFIGVLNPKYYPIASQAAKLIGAYKPILPELNNEEKYDHLLDLIGKNGLKALSKEEKNWLDDYSKTIKTKKG